MADKKKNGGMIHGNVYNETSGGSGPEDADLSGGGLYGDYPEVHAAHLAQSGADLVDSPNMRSGAGINGGPAPGESNPAGFSGTSESK